MKTTLKRLSLAIAASLAISPVYAATSAETDAADDAAIEEVIVKASRLKGTASAVMQERRDQAFIADIIGAEQISRTGDSDAAAALRRVTGVTLVDGKYIYIRGLGERYSSTQLNGAAVPSPDPTRTVIPLDLFPSSIVESLAVQKSYSVNLPAHFGGGNIDIRLKSIPSDFVFTMQGKLGGNTNNFDGGLTYDGGSDDWYGKDDGTRAAPAPLKELWGNYESLNDLSQQDNREIAAQMNRNYEPQETSINPNTGFNVTLGDRYDFDDFSIGFLSAVSYDNKWLVQEMYEGQDFTFQEGKDGEDDSWTMVRGYDQIDSTTNNVRFSGMFNFGLEILKDHRLEFNSLILHDTNDQILDKVGNSNNVTVSDGLRLRDSVVIYEEREMISNQVRGTHNFSQFWNLGFDWFYSDARSNRYAPGNISTRYILADGANGQPEDGIFDPINESSLRNANTASRYSYQNLDDNVENYGFNFSLPFHFSDVELEITAGGNFTQKTRDATARRIDINTLAFDGLDLTGYQMNEILTEDVMLNQPLSGNDSIARDTSIAGDDYYSGQMVDAYYIDTDFFIAQKWRIDLGLRYETFSQVVAPLDPATGQFDLPSAPTDEDLLALTYKDDDVFGAIALTYVMSETMQFRGSFAQTTIRPDIREVAPATYIDPLTGFPVGGTPSVTNTAIDNYDLRWEWYLQSGDNLSVGLFYKDMLNPIEAVQSPAQDGPPLIRIANAEDGYLYGIEVEFLKDFNFLGSFAGMHGSDFFLSGNFTVSESEINIDTQSVVDQTGVSTTITNPTRAMTGHSPWVVNMNLGWDAPNGNHSATLAYNVFAERIIIAGIDGKGDAYEEPFNSLDLVYTYYPTFSSKLNFKVQNILDQTKRLEFDDTLMRSATRGVTFEVSYEYDF
ncbi:TonB-dependent receptor domain-containing protein [Colwellia echini]|uniref:TonB-dependent receptor plug domain-containing protein n=1 Tax=Colwellia echini TaxID=1982103 RepID=A0ABY3MUJ4_9GAMM|nr:TonB-dependent receptor [Colwellia echini]TYK64794.1 TonB-dependent receptor plug domain-containing protein [Colwellia echini]